MTIITDGRTTNDLLWRPVTPTKKVYQSLGKIDSTGEKFALARRAPPPITERLTRQIHHRVEVCIGIDVL